VLKLLTAEEMKGKVRYHSSYWPGIPDSYVPVAGKEEQTGS